MTFLPPRVSILTSIFSDRSKQFDLSLASFTRQKFNPNFFELIALIDCPGEPDRKALTQILQRYKKFFSSVQCHFVHRTDQKVWHSATRRNFLAKQAKGDYILFTDPEMFHFGTTADRLVRQAREGNNREWYCGPVFATEGLVDRQGRVAIDDFAGKENTDQLLEVMNRPDITDSDRQFCENYHEIKGYKPLFFCTLLNKNFFIKLGGLAQNLRVRGWEEIEFFERFQSGGGKYCFDPNFRTCHLPHKRNLMTDEQMAWNVFNSTVVFNPDQNFGEMRQVVEEVPL